MASIKHRETLEEDLTKNRAQRARLEHEMAKYPADDTGEDDIFALKGA